MRSGIKSLERNYQKTRSRIATLMVMFGEVILMMFFFIFLRKCCRLLLPLQVPRIYFFYRWNIFENRFFRANTHQVATLIFTVFRVFVSISHFFFALHIHISDLSSCKHNKIVPKENIANTCRFQAMDYKSTENTNVDNLKWSIER